MSSAEEKCMSPSPELCFRASVGLLGFRLLWLIGVPHHLTEVLSIRVYSSGNALLSILLQTETGCLGGREVHVSLLFGRLPRSDGPNGLSLWRG